MTRLLIAVLFAFAVAAADRDGNANAAHKLSCGVYVAVSRNNYPSFYWMIPKVIGDAAGVSVSATELSLILGGVALSAKRRPRYVKPEEISSKTGISSPL